MAIDYVSITADIVALSVGVSLVSDAFDSMLTDVGQKTTAVIVGGIELDGLLIKISDYSVEAAAALAEKASLIDSILVVQAEVDFPGPPETRESLEAYYE